MSEKLREAVKAAIAGADNLDGMADAAIATIRDALREPSKEMTMRAHERVAICTIDGTWAIARDESARCWRAMLAASPLAAKEPGA